MGTTDGNDPQFAQLLTIPQVGRIFGWSRRHALRTLVAMHGRDRENGLSVWLFSMRDAPIRKRLLVNVSILRAQHPELWEKAPRDDDKLRTDLAGLIGDMGSMRGRVTDLRRQVNSQGARIRKLEEKIENRGA